MLTFFSTHYAIPTCSRFYRLCFELCPKFACYAQTMPIISGRSKLVQSNNCITLLCTTSQFHHQSQTRSRRLVGDLHQQPTWTVMWGLYHRVRPQACMGRDTSQSETGTQGLDTVWWWDYQSTWDIMLKKYYYSCIMLNAFRYHYSQNYAGIIRPTLPGECERCGSHILIAQEQLNVPRDTKLHLSRKDPNFKPSHHPAFSLFNWSFLTRAIHT